MPKEIELFRRIFVNTSVLHQANAETELLRKFHSQILKLSDLRKPHSQSFGHSLQIQANVEDDSPSTKGLWRTSDNRTSLQSDSVGSSPVGSNHRHGLSVDQIVDQRLQSERRSLSKDPGQIGTELLNSLNDITEEVTQLIAIKDIKDGWIC